MTTKQFDWAVTVGSKPARMTQKKVRIKRRSCFQPRRVCPALTDNRQNKDLTACSSFYLLYLHCAKFTALWGLHYKPQKETVFFMSNGPIGKPLPLNADQRSRLRTWTYLGFSATDKHGKIWCLMMFDGVCDTKVVNDVPGQLVTLIPGILRGWVVELI